MRRVWFVLLFLLLLGMSVWLGWRLISSGAESSSLVNTIKLPFGLGEVVLPLKKELSTDKTNFNDASLPKADFTRPVTTFLPNEQQKVDVMIVSRGYGEDGIERVLLRGIVSRMEKKYLEMVVGGTTYTVYFPRVFEQLCIPSTITDTKGRTVETKKGFIDLTTYRSGVEERGMEDVADILQQGDDALVLARYKEGDFVAITVAGYGCVR